MKGLIKEGAKQFKEARKNGELDSARTALSCPNCGTAYEIGDHFCSNCGKDLINQRLL